MTKPSQSPNRWSTGRTQWRDAVLALLEREHTPAQIAAQLGIAHWTAREIVNDLQREHLVTRIARGHYLRASPGEAVSPEPVRLIRDRLLEYLAEPRQVADVARHIERSSSIATGHLNRLTRQHLVVRISYGTYIRQDRRETVADIPMLMAICERIDRETSVEALCKALCRSERQLRHYLKLLTVEGTIERVGRYHYRPAQLGLFPSPE